VIARAALAAVAQLISYAALGLSAFVRKAMDPAFVSRVRFAARVVLSRSTYPDEPQLIEFAPAASSKDLMIKTTALHDVKRPIKRVLDAAAPTTAHSPISASLTEAFGLLELKRVLVSACISSNRDEGRIHAGGCVVF
jgi:hypothetical protein